MTINNSLNINTVTPLDLPRGGTSASLTASNGGIVYSSASAMAILSGTVTANQVVLSGSSSAPSFSTATYLPTLTANELLFASATNVMSQITTLANGVLITSNSSVPSLLANSGTPGFVLTANAGAPPSWQAVSSGSIVITGDTGSLTGASITIFANNVANNCGSSVLFSNTGTTSTFNVSDVNNNTMIGQLAGNATISGNQNVALGYQCLAALTSGRLNIAIGGTSTLLSLTTGTSNIAIGGAALQHATTLNDNIAIGTNALSSVIVGSQNVAIGSGALGTATSAAGMVAIGYNALPLCNSGNIVAIGYQSMAASTSSLRCVAVGSGTLSSSASDGDNTAVGYNALTTVNGGGGNVALGSLALTNLTTGGNNVAVGTSALTAALTEQFSTAVGQAALSASTAGSANTAIGFNTLQQLNGGASNTTLGYNTGNNLLTGNYNLFLGYDSGNSYTGSESANIAINTHGNETVGESHTLRIGGGTGTGGNQSLAHVYINGITGATPTSANTPQVVLCDNTSNLTVISSGTSGQVLTSNGSATPSFQTLVAQTPWTNESSAFTAAVYNGYFVTGTTTATLPTGTVSGQTIYFVAASASVLTIQAAGGQTIRLGADVSAANGTAASSAKGDSITLVYDTTGTSWYAIYAVGNAWTIT